MTGQHSSADSESSYPRVLVVTNLYPHPDRPFRGIFVRNQVESVRALGVDVDVFEIRGDESRANYVRSVPRLFRMLRQTRFDLFHAQHTYAFYIVWWVRFLLRLKTPIALTFRESEFMKPAGVRMDKAGIWGLLITSRRLKKRALLMADHVVSVWGGLMDAIGFEGPFEEIACGIDLDKFRPMDQRAARESLEWNARERVIFFPADAGRRNEKGGDVVAKAAEILRARGCPVRVAHAQNVPHEEMGIRMAAADVVVHPSRFDASPNVVKEAMAVGTPVVTTAVGDVEQVSTGLGNVLYVKPDPSDVADKIERALRLKPNEEGRVRLQELDLTEQAVARRLHRLYLTWARPRPVKRVAVVRCAHYPQDPRVFKEVRALQEVGFSATVLCLRGSGEPLVEELDGVAIHRMDLERTRESNRKRLAVYSRFLLWAGRGLWRLHREARLAAVQVNTLPDFLVFCAIPVKLRGVPVVLDLHEVLPELFESEYRGRLKPVFLRLLKLTERASVRVADRVICPGPPYLETYRSRRLPIHKFSLVYNTPDEDVITRTEVHRDRSLMVAHGSIIERYGFELLIEALPEIIRNCPDVKLEIIGDGENLERVKRLANERGVSQHVDFLGRIPFETVASRLQRAAVGLVTTVSNDFTNRILPNKIYELVALGVPVVSSRIEGLHAQFDSHSIRYFDAGDKTGLAHAATSVLQSPEDGLRLVENATRVYDEIRWSRNKRTYQKVFVELGQGSRR